MKIKLSEHICVTSKCLKSGGHSNIVLAPKGKAKGVSYILENDKKIFISYYDLDDCAYPIKNKPAGFKLCDYVVVLHNDKKNKKEETYIWIEVKKTSDFDFCCNQILNSYNNAVNYGEDITHYARIVLGKINKNNISSDSTKRLKTVFKNRFDYSSQVYDKDTSSKLYTNKN